MAFEVGCDDEGLYSRTSHSPKMRKPDDYIADAIRRFGDGMNPQISHGFADMHYHMLRDLNLVYYLQDTKNSIKGEMLWLPFGKMIDSNTIQFVGTGYNIDMLGMYGTFIVHSQLNEQMIPFEDFLQDRINWYDDIVHDAFVLSPLTAFRNIEQLSLCLLNTFKPKWGHETEGYVFHPANKSLPKFKVIDPRWKERRERIRV